MTLSVRIPPRFEQELIEYCARKGVSQSEAVKDAVDQVLSVEGGDESPYEVMKDLIGPARDDPPSADIAKHSKRLLCERIRSRRK